MNTPENWSPVSRKTKHEIGLAGLVIGFQSLLSENLTERLVGQGDGEIAKTLKNVLRDDQENIILPIPTDDPDYSPDAPYYYFSEPELEELVEHATAAISRSELGTGE